jgi:hypothetical protein
LLAAFILRPVAGVLGEPHDTELRIEAATGKYRQAGQCF